MTKQSSCTISAIALGAVALFGSCSKPPAPAGPLACPSGPSTYSGQLADYEVAAVAKLVQETPWNGWREPTASYEIVEVLKGQSLVAVGDRVTCSLEGGALIGERFLLVSDAEDRLKWLPSSRLTSAEQEYVTKLFRLPTAADRLHFYLQHIESADDGLARDATDELTLARFADLQVLKPHLQHDRIIERLHDAELGASRRRVYFKLLSLCGTAADVPLLEQLLRSPNKEGRSGLDAAIACYLSLQKEAGLPLVEQQFLQDRTADYASTYCAIMALRFHLHETKVINRERLIASLRVMLTRPELADLVIPDLAEQQDWSCLERLFELFKTADTENTWLRVPIINYLRRCPLLQAKEILAECERLDPKAAERARTVFPDNTAEESANSPEK